MPPQPPQLTGWDPVDPRPARLRRELAGRLREAFDRSGYDVEGVAAHLGPTAHAAMARHDYRPATRATGDGSPLSGLIRLFLLGADIPNAVVAEALGPLDPAAAVEAGLLEPGADPDTLRAALEIRPYAEADGPTWWVVSDHGSDVRPGPLRSDHVLGVGGASLTLAGATVRREVGTALDLGIGCGVQALHLARHSRQVTGTDLSPRALAFAALTAELAGYDWELLAGSFAEPVAQRRFDLIVSNPPFVIGPGANPGAGSDIYTYRDSGRAGDAAARHLVETLPRLLTPGGWCQLLSNWAHVRDRPWVDRVGEWVTAAGCDAWVVQREVQDPSEYVAMWLRDSGEDTGPAYAERYDRWLAWLDEQDVEAIGFGVISLRRTDVEPVVRIEEMRQAVTTPLGPEIESWFARQDWLRARPSTADLLGARLRTSPHLVLDQRATPGPEGWTVDRQTLALDAGPRWSTDVDPIAAALAAGCTGEVTLGDQLAVLSAAFDVGVPELTAGAVPVVRYLVERGFLVPAVPAD